jgi:hypothetical protein
MHGKLVKNKDRLSWEHPLSMGEKYEKILLKYKHAEAHDLRAKVV